MPAKHPFRGGGSLLFNQPKARSLSLPPSFHITGVIARLDRAIQCAETSVIEAIG